MESARLFEMLPLANGGLYSRVPEYVNWKGRGKQYANEAKKIKKKIQNHLNNRKENL